MPTRESASQSSRIDAPRPVLKAASREEQSARCSTGARRSDTFDREKKPVMAKRTSPLASGSMTSPVGDVEPNLNRAEELVMQLMALPGRSGEEAVVAEFIRKQLQAAGVARESMVTDNAHKKTPLVGNTGNLILKLPGTLKGPRRMFSAHMDTVPLCAGSQPRREGDFVRSANPATALGADDRSGVAVVLNTALEIIERKLPTPPLTFCWFIQEEIGLYGARCVEQRLLGKPAMCFNYDGGSAAKVTIGATGGYRMAITVRGVASHAGVAPQNGASAIAIASLAIADLQRGGWHGLVEKGSQRGTSNVGVIQGGEATNVVTDLVHLRAEARSHNPKFRERIVREVERAFRNAAKEVKTALGKRGSVEIEGRLDYEAFQIPASDRCVLLAQEAIVSIDREAELAISNGGLDANWLNAHGIPTVTLGSGQMQPHMTSEALNVPEFHDGCRIALRLATRA
jgi:tripeptide aminopeptidase